MKELDSNHQSLWGSGVSPDVTLVMVTPAAQNRADFNIETTPEEEVTPAPVAATMIKIRIPIDGGLNQPPAVLVGKIIPLMEEKDKVTSSYTIKMC